MIYRNMASIADEKQNLKKQSDCKKRNKRIDSFDSKIIFLYFSYFLN